MSGSEFLAVQSLGFIEYSNTGGTTLSYINGIGLPMTRSCEGAAAGCTDGGYGGWQSFQERLQKYCPGEVKLFQGTNISYCGAGQQGDVASMPFGRKWDIPGTFSKAGVTLEHSDVQNVMTICQSLDRDLQVDKQCRQVNRGASGCTGEDTCEGERLFYQDYDMRDVNASGSWHFNGYAAFVHTICGVHAGSAFYQDVLGAGSRGNVSMSYDGRVAPGECEKPVVELCPGASPSFAESGGFTFPPPAPTSAPSSATEQERSCLLWGDPHVATFDSEASNGHRSYVDFLGRGDFWLVHSDEIRIQGRYYTNYRAEGSAARALAIGGPFLQGHQLVIDALQGRITWDGQPILTELLSEFKVESLVEAHSRATTLPIDRGMVKDVPETNRTVAVQLPLGVRVMVNRWLTHIDVNITMRARPGQMSGQCGNFNGDFADDTPELINARESTEVAMEDLLFTPADFRFVGCFKDKVTDRDFPISRGQKALEDCAFACSGSKYFGRQYDGECWCGDSYGKHGPEENPCACEETNVGPHHNCVYSYGGGDAVHPKALLAPKGVALEECPAERRVAATEACLRSEHRAQNFDHKEGSASAFLDQNQLEACIFDACFGGEEKEEGDAMELESSKA
jgi:hypothetical protein